MASNRVTISAEVRERYDNVPDWWRTATITVPSWCSGDPAMAVALYLFGHRDAVADIRNARVI